MGRCDCAKGRCQCGLVAGDGIEITGTGETSSPYTITALAQPLTGQVAVADTATLNLTLTGQGTVGEPYTLSGEVLGAPPPSDAAVAGLVTDPGSDTHDAVQGVVDDAVAEVAAQLNVDRVVTDTAVSGTYLIDLAAGDVFVLTLTGNTALNVSGLVPGRSFVVQANQDMAGGHTLTLPPDTLGNVTITPTANTFETIIFRSNTGIDLIAHQATGGPVELPFSPERMVDQVAWYNAETVAGEQGSAIGRWPNSFADRALGTNTAANMPTLEIVNGVNVLRFDGETDKMVTVDDDNAGANLVNSMTAPGVTVAALVKITGSDAAIRYVFQGQDVNPIQMFVSSGAGRVWTIRANGVSVLGPTFAAGWAVVVGIYNGASSKIRVNGVEMTGTVGSDTALALRVAGPASGSCAAGDFAEIIIVEHAAGADEIADLEAYLGEKRTMLEAV